MKKVKPLRDFIFDRLYHKKDGYFCRKDLQIGQLQGSINFKNLIGYDDYQKQLHSKYPKNAWLTPSQIFKPYYGMTIANYINQAQQRRFTKHKIKDKIRIVQAGAGLGSAAQSILYYFQNFNNKQLQSIQYTIVQISPILCKRMQQKLSRSYAKLFNNKQIKIINDDIINYSNRQFYYAIFLQVLDNFPHDKVLWNQQRNIYQNYATVDLDSKIESISAIKSDLLIQECLNYYLEAKINNKQQKNSEKILDKIANFLINRKNQSGKNKSLFLPTYLLKLLKNAKITSPNIHFIISDFDHLLSQVQGINAPIVSQKGEKSFQKKDYASYLVDRGQADIFFPVDFKLLQLMHKKILNRNCLIAKSSQFIEQFSQQKWANTKSGFNPIRQDFGNTSFLVSQI